MTPDVEDRLRELAEHRRAEARVEPELWARIVDRTEPKARPWRTWGIVLVAAVPMIAVALIATGVLRSSDDTATPVASGGALTVPMDEFLELVDPVCGTFERAINGNGPRFETPEAFAVANGVLRDAAEAAAAGLSRLPTPEGQEQLPGRLLGQLRSVIRNADASTAAAEEGHLTSAADLFAFAAGTAGDVLGQLHELGAPCTLPLPEGVG